MSINRYILSEIKTKDKIKESNIKAVIEFDTKNRRKDGRYIKKIQEEIDKMEEKVINDGYEIRIERAEQRKAKMINDNNSITKHTLYFHLVENNDDNIDTSYTFMATVGSKKKHEEEKHHLPLKDALEIYKDDDALIRLYATIYEAAEKSSLISELVDSGHLFHPLAWTKAEADQFMIEIQTFIDIGIKCRVPKNYESGLISIY